MKYPCRKWMYHKDQAEQIFVIQSDQEYQDLLSDGWRDSPADLDKPEPKQKAPAKDSKPEESKGKGESKPSDDYDIGELMETFVNDPESMDKDALLVLGKSLSVRLHPSWKQKTLISKIQGKLDAHNKADN